MVQIDEWEFFTFLLFNLSLMHLRAEKLVLVFHKRIIAVFPFLVCLKIAILLRYDFLAIFTKIPK